jgi:hypothetical protein
MRESSRIYSQACILQIPGHDTSVSFTSLGNSFACSLAVWSMTYGWPMGSAPNGAL